MLAASHTNFVRILSLLLAYVVDNLGPHPDLTGASRALLLGGKQPQLAVKIFSMNSIQRVIDILVIIWNQHLHVGAVDKARFSY